MEDEEVAVVVDNLGLCCLGHCCCYLLEEEAAAAGVVAELT